MLSRRSDWERQCQQLTNLTAEQLQNAANDLANHKVPTCRDVFALLDCMRTMSEHSPLSQATRLYERRALKGMVQRFGPPAIWVTLNPADLKNPLILEIAGLKFPNQEMSLNSVKRVLAVLTCRDPVASARFFAHMISTFLKCLVKPDRDDMDHPHEGYGAFGDIEEYFGTVEANGCGALHFHGMMWYRGNIDLTRLKQRIQSDTQLQAKVLAFMSSTFREDVDMQLEAPQDFNPHGGVPLYVDTSSIEEFETQFHIDSNTISRRKQMHKHSHTCYKFAQGKNGCRFGAPWPLHPGSIDEDGMLIPAGIVIFT